MIDPRTTCTVSYATFTELNQFGQKTFKYQAIKQELITAEIRMIGHTFLAPFFNRGAQYKAKQIVWVTEDNTFTH